MLSPARRDGDVMRRTRHDHPFVVEVGALCRAPGSRREVSVEGEIADLAVSFSRVPEGAPIQLEGILESVHEGVLFTGSVRARWQGDCRRCLGPASGEIVAEVRELCAEGLDDELVYRIDSDELDLEPIVHDACILELPLAPLCREGCLGLCPDCGADRNLEPCSCGPREDPRWAPLVLLGGGAGPASSSGHGAAASGPVQRRGGRRPPVRRAGR